MTGSPTSRFPTLSLHDALPILLGACGGSSDTTSTEPEPGDVDVRLVGLRFDPAEAERSEEHTSELQSQFQLVCRLLLEKKNPQPLLHRPRPDDGPSARGARRTHAHVPL